MSTRDLAGDYAAGAPALAPFFARGRGQLVESAAQVPPAWTPAIVELLHAEQARLGLPPRAIAGHAIVTGQQPGLFVGPLYTVYKAITAIQLAERLTQQSGQACTPVFWSASEDHDFEEVQAAHFLSKQHTTLSLRYTPEGYREGMPMYRVPIERSLHALVDEAAARTPGSEWRAPIRAALLEALEASSSLAEWSLRCLARLFADTPLVFFAPHWPAARQAALPILRRAIEEPLEATRCLNLAGEHLAAIGYGAQVIKAPEECAFFVEHDTRRCKMIYADGLFRAPEVRAHYTRDELLHLLDHAPERFSPNVVLRPIMQQHLFPTLAYIGGPGEIAYWAQLRGVFDFFGLPMPVVYPRLRAVFTTPKIEKLRDTYALSYPQLLRPATELIGDALARLPSTPAVAAYREAHPPVFAALGALERAVASAEPGARAEAARMRDQVQRQLGRFEHRLLFADRQQRDTVAQQIARIQALLAPMGQPQERVYTLYSFLFEHGFGLVARLRAALDAESPMLQEFVL